MKKILIVFGTRPESLKVYPLIFYSGEFKNLKVESYFTNQHEKKYIDFEPDHNSFLMGGYRIPKDIGGIYSDLDWFLTSNGKKCDYVLVQGDTYSALAGALWGYYNQIPVIHVESGLRSYKEEPFPEEKNRVMIDMLSQIKFCPTNENAQNLYNEKTILDMNNCYVVGNTIIDRLKMELNFFKQNFNMIYTNQGYFLCTLHRRESWNMFEEMIGYLRLVAETLDKEFIFVTNPNKKLNEVFKDTKEMKIIKPMEYRTMINLLINSDAIITDSGGLIEEAAYLKKPCYILRDCTERKESLDLGLAKLLGRDKGILDIIPLEKSEHFWFNREAACPYGQGDTARQILNILNGEDYMSEEGDCKGRELVDKYSL